MPAVASTLRAKLERTGIRRTGGPRNGFRYRRAGGSPVGAAERARIASLRIPPAWREVTIAADPTARVQAVGRDAAGRWQYLYRAEHTRRRARSKFDRMLRFAAALPSLRAALKRDLARPGMPLERACAAAVLLLTAAALRIGTDRYVSANGTYGLATLQPEHVTVRGGTVRLAFRGKHGVWQEQVLRSLRLARLVRELLAMPGRELLKYHDARGRLRDLRHEHVSAYVKRVMGASFSPKDFRTWGATLVCAGALARLARGGGEGAADDGRLVTAALAETARWLGNTPKVARESYVHPAVLVAARDGRVVRCALKRPEVLAERLPRGLHAAERELVRLLRRD